MATTQQHAGCAAQSRQLAEADFNDHLAIAGRIMWGALIQAAQASIHRSQPDCHPISRTGIITTLNLATSPGPDKFRLRQAANVAARILGDGFYHPYAIIPEQHRLAIDEARCLIDHLTRRDPV